MCRSRVPCALRPTTMEGRYKFMGESYVQGVILGEHIRQRRELLGDEGRLQLIAPIQWLNIVEAWFSGASRGQCLCLRKTNSAQM